MLHDEKTLRFASSRRGMMGSRAQKASTAMNANKKKIHVDNGKIPGMRSSGFRAIRSRKSSSEQLASPKLTDPEKSILASFARQESLSRLSPLSPEESGEGKDVLRHIKMKHSTFKGTGYNRDLEKCQHKNRPSLCRFARTTASLNYPLGSRPTTGRARAPPG